MGRPKRKKPAEIRSELFTKEHSLNSRDLECVRSETEEEAFNLLVPGWTGKIIAYMGLYLKPDNLSASEVVIITKGFLFEDQPRVHAASKFFNLKTPLQVVFSTLDCGKFTFNASLTSDLVDSSNFDFWFRVNRDSDPLGDAEAKAAGFKGFALRAFLQPTSITTNTWLRLTVVLFPAAKDQLIADNPAANSPLFPGISLFSQEIQMAPRTTDLFPGKRTGLPILPALISSTPFSDAAYLPTDLIIGYVAATLRDVTVPNCALHAGNLSHQWATIARDGAEALRPTSSDILWPAAPSQPEATPGSL